MNPKTKWLGLLLAPALAVTLVPVTTRANSNPAQAGPREPQNLAALALIVPALGSGNRLANAEPDVPAGFENITSTAELSGPELAFGTLTSASGEQPRVYVYATPSMPADIQVGDQLPDEVPVAIGEVTGSSFNAIADPSVDLTRFLNESSSVVDFRAIGLTSEHVGMVVFSRRLDARGQIIEPLDTGPEYVASDNGELSTVAEPTAVNLDVSHELEEAPAGTVTGARQCYVTDDIRKRTMIGAGFHRKGKVPLKLTYYRGSTSELGVGVRYDGGNWDVGGSVERSNSSGSGTQWLTKGLGDLFHYTVFEIKHTRCNWTCTSGPSCWWGFEEYRPDRYIGGNKNGDPRWYPVIHERNCVGHNPAGSGYELIVDESKAIKYRGGIRFTFRNFTLNLSAQSGFNEKTSILGDVKRRRQICGWTGSPGFRPGLIQVGKPG